MRVNNGVGSPWPTAIRVEIRELRRPCSADYQALKLEPQVSPRAYMIGSRSSASSRAFRKALGGVPIQRLKAREKLAASS